LECFFTTPKLDFFRFVLIFNTMNRRQKTLLDKLARLGRISIETEAPIFGVSEMTIRRDIIMLDEMGLAIRTHGGAVPRTDVKESILAETRSTDGQKRIAKKVLELIPDACTLMLSTGSTTLEIARYLAVSGKRLSVVTNSLPIAAALFQTPVQVILTGGTLRSDSLDLAGPVTEKNLDEYYIDMLVSGCDGADATEGFFTKDINLAEMERKAVQKSKKVIIAAEACKFERRAFVKFASPKEISTVVTDVKLAAADVKALEKAGVKLIVSN